MQQCGLRIQDLGLTSQLWLYTPWPELIPATEVEIWGIVMRQRQEGLILSVLECVSDSCDYVKDT